MQLLLCAVACGALCLILSGVVTARFPLLTFPDREVSCRDKHCEGTDVCRYVEKCKPDSPNCSLPHNDCSRPRATCLRANLSRKTSHGCLIGQPLLTKTSGNKHELRVCYRGHECPDGFFCSTALQDASARCCPIPRPPPPKPGRCPKHVKDGLVECVGRNRTCHSDADCKGPTKCCQYSLSCPGKTCLPVAPPQHPCDSVQCEGPRECRLVEECDSVNGCSPPKPTCVRANVSQQIDYGCLKGRPLIAKSPGTGYELRVCSYRGNSCPGGFFCSIALQDAASRCCPVPPVGRMTTPLPPWFASMGTSVPLPLASAPMGTFAPLPTATPPMGRSVPLPPAPVPLAPAPAPMSTHAPPAPAPAPAYDPVGVDGPSYPAPASP